MDKTERRDHRKIMTAGAEALEGFDTQNVVSPKVPLNYEVESPDQSNPSELEHAQCEAQVGTSLRIISELNGKMNALQKPSPSSKHSQTELHAVSVSKTSETKKEDGVELWAELQGALAALEVSIVMRKTWIIPYIACDEGKETQHLSAARESWVQLTQILEEMEREYGISYPSELPPEERQQYQQDVLAVYKVNCGLRSTLQCREEELGRSKVTLTGLEKERNRFQVKLLELQNTLPIGASISPPSSPCSWSSGTPSLCCASPPCSPLLSKRSPNSTCAPSTVSSLETELDRLQRCIERLRARNERLSAALEKRKGESEHLSMTLSRHEADSTALQMALRFSEECEEAYSQLLFLRDAGEKPDVAEVTGIAESAKQKQALTDPTLDPRSQATVVSLNFSRCPSGGDKQCVEQNREILSVLGMQEAAIWEKIERLKKDRAALCIPEQKPDGEGKLSPDTGTLAGPRGQGSGRPINNQIEKTALLYELISVREEMSELRGVIRLTEKERRCLEWTLTAQRAQDMAAALVADCLREELDNRRAKPAQKTAAMDTSGVPGPQHRTVLREIQAVRQREETLKGRVTTLRDSLDAVLTDSITRRRYCEDEMAQLALTHSKAAGMYRNTRRKYHEQLWRLERQVMALSERHVTQISGLKATLEALKGRKEETVL